MNAAAKTPVGRIHFVAWRLRMAFSFALFWKTVLWNQAKNVLHVLNDERQMGFKSSATWGYIYVYLSKASGSKSARIRIAWWSVFVCSVGCGQSSVSRALLELAAFYGWASRPCIPQDLDAGSLRFLRWSLTSRRSRSGVGECGKWSWLYGRWQTTTIYQAALLVLWAMFV